MIEKIMEQAEREGRLPALVELEHNFEIFPYIVPHNMRGWILEGNSYMRETEVTLEDGSKATGRWAIEISSFGSLTAFDSDVLMALMETVAERGWDNEDGELEFSFSELLERMGIEDSGKIRADVKRSLRRWASTTFHSDRAFWIREKKKRYSGTLNVLSDVVFWDQEEGQGRRGFNRLHFGKLFRESVLKRYVALIDVSFYWSLENKVARKLYRILEATRREKNELEMELVWLHGAIGLSCRERPYDIKRGLARAHQELVDSSYLSAVEFPQRGKVCYRLSPAYLERYQLLSSGLQTAEEAKLARRLASVKGLSKREAAELVLEHGAERAARGVAALSRQRGIKSPAGWLKWVLSDERNLEQFAPSGQQADHRTLASGFPVTRSKRSAAASDREASSPPACSDPDPRASALFERALARLDDAPSPGGWFSDVIATAVSESTLTLSVPNSFAADYIGQRFLPALQEALAADLGEGASVELVVRGG